MNTTDLLTQLDAAPAAPLTDAEAARSDALLRAVIADREPARAPRPARSHRARYWAFGVAGVAALAIMATAALHFPHWTPPAPTGPSGSTGPLASADLASWTSAPTGLAAGAASVQAPEKWCLDSMSGAPGASNAGVITNVDQRGSITSMIVSRAGYTMLCIAGPNATGFWEVDGDPSEPGPALAPAQLTVESEGAHGQGATGFDYIEGLAGAGVASVSFTSAGRTIDATVANGRWTAWWPDAAATAQLTGTVTITSTDGSTSTVSAAGLQN
jgi:hypothetical protein